MPSTQSPGGGGGKNPQKYPIIMKFSDGKPIPDKVELSLKITKTNE